MDDYMFKLLLMGKSKSKPLFQTFQFVISQYEYSLNVMKIEQNYKLVKMYQQVL